MDLSLEQEADYKNYELLLKNIKEKLINNLSTAPLFNTKRFTKNLETAYKNIYERHRQGNKPHHIIVEHESS